MGRKSQFWPHDGTYPEIKQSAKMEQPDQAEYNRLCRKVKSSTQEREEKKVSDKMAKAYGLRSKTLNFTNNEQLQPPVVFEIPKS